MLPRLADSKRGNPRERYSLMPNGVKEVAREEKTVRRTGSALSQNLGCKDLGWGRDVRFLSEEELSVKGMGEAHSQFAACSRFDHELDRLQDFLVYSYESHVVFLRKTMTYRSNMPVPIVGPGNFFVFLRETPESGFRPSDDRARLPSPPGLPGSAWIRQHCGGGIRPYPRSEAHL